MFRFLGKRYVDISMILKDNSIFLVFSFKKYRTKMLKGQRIFYAQVFCGEVSFEKFFSELRSWLEVTTEDYLLERLEDSPKQSRPIIGISDYIKLDFNATEEEVFSSIPSSPFP